MMCKKHYLDLPPELAEYAKNIPAPKKHRKPKNPKRCLDWLHSWCSWHFIKWEIPRIIFQKKTARLSQRNEIARFLFAHQFDSIKVNSDYNPLERNAYTIDELEQLLIITSDYEQLLRFSKRSGKLSNDLEKYYG